MGSSQHSCSATVFGDRVQMWTCSRSGVVQRNGKWFCRQHDPEEQRKRQEARDAKWRAERSADEIVEREAAMLCRRIGCGHRHWHDGKTQRSIVISFDEARELARRLETPDGE
jgi:hypothetical protein